MKNRFDIHTDSLTPFAAETRLQQENQVLKIVGSELPLDEKLVALVRAVEAQSREMLCAILLLDADRRHLRHGAAPSLPADFRDMIDALALGEHADSSHTAAFRREKVWIADIATDPLWASYRELALRHGLHTCWSRPIFDAGRRVLGTIVLYFRQARVPQTSDLWLVEMTAHAAAIAISLQENAEKIRRREARVREQENRLQALKSEVNGLMAALGRPDRYPGIRSK